MFLALGHSPLPSSAPLSQLPCLTTAQRSAAHLLHWKTLHNWCWREILTASVLVKQICPFGQVKLLLARGFPHSSAWQAPTAGHRHRGWSSAVSLAYGCLQTIPTSTQTRVTILHCPQGQKICFIFSPVQFIISHSSSRRDTLHFQSDSPSSPLLILYFFGEDKETCFCITSNNLVFFWTHYP